MLDLLDLKQVKVYIVGGYVRDRLLRRECKDHDFVVVGATPQMMFANGFQKVGADFPVYLHPETGDEYALARTERKTSAGYNGFETDFNPSITLKEDLERRDLTVNAMAREVLGWNEEGHAKLSDEIIDPFNGQKDLQEGVLRHVSDAFADDPVRVLRVARFAARYGFVIDVDTIYLMQRLVNDGELDHLVPERVWTEFEKAMGEEEPSKFFWSLQFCGAYDLLFPELGKSIISSGYALKTAALLELPVLDRMVIVFSAIDKFEDAANLLARLKAPSDVHRLTRKTKMLLNIINTDNVMVGEVLDLLNSIDAFNNNTDLKICTFTILTCIGGAQNRVSSILMAFRSAKKISFDSLSNEEQKTLTGKSIGIAINEHRLQAIKDVWRW